MEYNTHHWSVLILQIDWIAKPRISYHMINPSHRTHTHKNTTTKKQNLKKKHTHTEPRSPGSTVTPTPRTSRLVAAHWGRSASESGGLGRRPLAPADASRREPSEGGSRLRVRLSQRNAPPNAAAFAAARLAAGQTWRPTALKLSALLLWLTFLSRWCMHEPSRCLRGSARWNRSRRGRTAAKRTSSLGLLLDKGRLGGARKCVEGTTAMDIILKRLSARLEHWVCLQNVIAKPSESRHKMFNVSN